MLVQKHVVVLLIIMLFAANAVIVPQPASARPSAVIQNDSMRIDSNGWLRIVGEVKNTGDVWLRFVKITGTLKNANGQVVDVQTTFTLMEYLPPGAKSPFDLMESDPSKASTISSYSLVLNFQQATSTLANSLTIQNTGSSIDSLGILEVVGEIRNNGPQISNFTKVIATFYDNFGKVIAVAFTFTSPADIPSGQAYGFKVLGPSSPTSSHVANFALTAESSQYISL